MTALRCGLFARALVLAGALAAPAGGQLIGPTADQPWHEARRLRSLVQAGTATAEDSLRLARRELELGNVEAAAALVEALRSSGRADLDFLVLAGQTEERLARWPQAAEWYARAAVASTGSDGGVLHARAAAAYELSGRMDRAAREYANARERLPDIAGWLALREAAVTSSSLRAFELIRLPPEPGRPLAHRVRADRLLAAGDSARAVRALVAAGDVRAAAALAWVGRDTVTARALTFRALATASVEDARVVLNEFVPLLEPTRPVHDLALADAYMRVGDHDAAVRALQRALRGLGPTPRGLRMLGDALADADRFEEADSAYAEAEAMGGAEGGTAAFRRAMLGGRERDRPAYRAGLLSFAERFPAHTAAPRAVWLAAEDLRESGRQDRAAEWYRHLDARWPGATVASAARLRLAEMARAGGDVRAAAAWYEREIAVRGAERNAATYLLAGLRQALGEGVAARLLWEELAAADPWGYHGAMARRALGWTLPPLGRDAENPPTARVRADLVALDLLVRAGLDREAGIMLEWLMAREDLALDEQLGLASGLIARGWTEEGVRLGWRVARERSLGDPRVLRVIFPWPYRVLIEQEAAEHGVDPFLLAALIRQESTFRPHVGSRAGARGMMQLMPATARWLAERSRLEWDERLLVVPDVNIHLGATHLASLLTTYRGDEFAALAAYNAGGRPTDRWRQRAAGAGPFEFVRTITYAETRGYVQAVVRNRDLYRALYAPAGSHGEP